MHVDKKEDQKVNLLRREDKRIIHVFAPSRSGHNFIMNIMREWFLEDLVHVSNLENRHPSEKATQITNRKEVGILVIRDYKNWAASILKWTLKRQIRRENQEIARNDGWRLRRGLRPRHLEGWWAIFREGINATNYLNNKITIHYLEFMHNEEYRRDICEKLGGDYSEDRLHEVAESGGGSSFDGELKTDERYLWWETHENSEYREIYAREVKKIEELNKPVVL